MHKKSSLYAEVSRIYCDSPKAVFREISRSDGSSDGTLLWKLCVTSVKGAKMAQKKTYFLSGTQRLRNAISQRPISRFA